MAETRLRPLSELERTDASCGREVERSEDGTPRATGPGGGSWIGLAVVPEDLENEAFEERRRPLSEHVPCVGRRAPSS